MRRGISLLQKAVLQNKMNIARGGVTRIPQVTTRQKRYASVDTSRFKTRSVETPEV
jgi:hypothetical protein